MNFPYLVKVGPNLKAQINLFCLMFTGNRTFLKINKILETLHQTENIKIKKNYILVAMVMFLR